MDPVRIPAGQVILRPHTDADIDAVLDQCTDPDSVLWTTIPVPYARSNAEDFVRNTVPDGWRTGNFLAFAIADAETDEFLGTIDIRPDGANAGEVGFGLRRSARGRGAMTAAVRAITGWSFSPDGLGLEVLFWRAAVGNYSSRRVAWATGFRVEGMVRDNGVQRGKRVDMWIGSLRATDLRTPAHPWFEAAVINGDGLRLRPAQESDADAIAEACSDAETRQWLGELPTPYTRESALSYIRTREAEHASGAGIYWIAADPETDRCLGSFGISNFQWGTRSAELGYWVHPAARGRGVATTAATMLIRHASIDVPDGGLGLARLTLRAAAGNKASQRVAEKAGFERVGVERRAERLGDGTLDDLVRFDLLL